MRKRPMIISFLHTCISETAGAQHKATNTEFNSTQHITTQHSVLISLLSQTPVMPSSLIMALRMHSVCYYHKKNYIMQIGKNKAEN